MMFCLVSEPMSQRADRAEQKRGFTRADVKEPCSSESGCRGMQSGDTWRYPRLGTHGRSPGDGLHGIFFPSVRRGDKDISVIKKKNSF